VSPRYTHSYFLHSRLLDSKIVPLEKTVQELRNKLTESQRAADQDKDALNKTINSLRADLQTRDESSSALLVQLADTQRKADGLIRINHAHEQKHQCGFLYAQGRIHRAAECLFEIANTVGEDVRANKLIMDWLSGEFQRHASGQSIQSLPSEFTHQCVMTLERVGDEASNAGKRDEADAAYSTALLLGPSTLNAVVMKWADPLLIRGSAGETLKAAAKVCSP